MNEFEFKECDVIAEIGKPKKYIIVGLVVLDGVLKCRLREIRPLGLSSVRYKDAERVEMDYVKVGRWVFDEMTIGVEVDDE